MVVCVHACMHACIHVCTFHSIDEMKVLCRGLILFELHIVYTRPCTAHTKQQKERMLKCELERLLVRARVPFRKVCAFDGYGRQFAPDHGVPQADSS